MPTEKLPSSKSDLQQHWRSLGAAGISPEGAAKISAAVQRGQEIDVRPDPAGVRAGMETTAIRRPRDLTPAAELADNADPEDGYKWPKGHTTGAFISAAASSRHEVAPYRWWQTISGPWMLVWAVVLGVPVAAGVWAGLVIWNRLHG